jgi:hypothetical protein
MGRSAASILAFYQLGRRVLERAAADLSSVAAAARALAVAEGVGPDRALKAARFAGTLSRRDVARLCHPGRSSLSADHIRCVLKIARRQDRTRWLDRAAEAG